MAPVGETTSICKHGWQVEVTYMGIILLCQARVARERGIVLE